MSSSFCPQCKRLFKPSVLARHDGLCPRCARNAEDEDEDDQPAPRRKRKKSWATGDPVSHWLWIILGVETLIAVVLFLVMLLLKKADPLVGIYLFSLILAGWVASRVVFDIDSGSPSGLSRIDILIGMVATIFRRPQILLTFVLAVAYAAVGIAFVPRPAGNRVGSRATQQPPPSDEPGSAAPGLRAHWSFDEGRGDRAIDSGPNRLEARLRGCRWVPGVRGTAIQFNGTSDHVELSDSRTLNFAANASFTLAAWVKTSKADGHVLSFRIAQDKTFDLLNIFFDRGKLVVWIRRQGNPRDPQAVTTLGQVNDGRWHHFAARRTADGEVALYLDGTFQGKLNKPDQTQGKIITNQRTLGVEASDSRSARLEGCIDELRIYGDALSDKDIAALARP